MADIEDFLPLFPDDDEEAILARMREWANEGVDPSDTEAWVDTREGSHWHVCVMPAVRDLARLYDLAGSEVPASGFVLWSWGDYLDDHAEVQDIVRLAETHAIGDVTFTGPEGTVIPAGARVGVEPVVPDGEAPEFEVTIGGVIPAPVAPALLGEVVLAVRAVEGGEASNVGPGAITVVSTPLPGVSVTNVAAMGGGSGPETDEALRERVLTAYQGQGAGNRRDYIRWARAWEGVGRATVIPLWNGPGTVKVVVTDAAGDPLPAAVVDALQADLDPEPGLAAGQAPVGAHVTVETAIGRPIEVEADIEFEPGYSLDGFGGTVAQRDVLRAALRDYVERVPSGGEIVVAQLAGRLATILGVHDVRIVSLEGVAPPVNVQISADPPEAPQLTEPTFNAAVL